MKILIFFIPFNQLEGPISSSHLAIARQFNSFLIIEKQTFPELRESTITNIVLIAPIVFEEKKIIKDFTGFEKQKHPNKETVTRSKPVVCFFQS